MGTAIQDTQQRNDDRQPRWDRFERADLFEHYRELRAQGMSQRQAAQELQVPRTASITASATFGHSASPDTVTYWHIMALQ